MQTVNEINVGKHRTDLVETTALLDWRKWLLFAVHQIRRRRLGLVVAVHRLISLAVVDP
jgi:hypothetical protein